MSMFRRRLLIYQALMNKSGNIVYPGLIAAWSAKGKTNDDEDRAILKDLTGNGHDITLNGFAFSEMSGYGGYKTNFNNWAYIEGRVVFKRESNKIIITKSNTDAALLYYNATFNTMKVKVTGLQQNQLIKFGHDSTNNIVKTITKDGTYDIDFTNIGNRKPRYIMAGFIGECNIIIEFLPEYPDALVFDGIDDYGVNEDMPILTDYTIIYHLQRDILNSSNGAVISKGYTDGEFSAEEWRNNFINFGYKNRVNAPLYDICYGTLKLYNGKLLNKGGAAGSNEITIGRTSSNTSYYRSIAFYSAYLFDHSLDEQEIKAFIRKYIDPEYLLPSEKIPTPDCYYDFSKGNNDDETRDTIKDYSGNGNDAVAHNFA